MTVLAAQVDQIHIDAKAPGNGLPRFPQPHRVNTAGHQNGKIEIAIGCFGPLGPAAE